VVARIRHIVAWSRESATSARCRARIDGWLHVLCTTSLLDCAFRRIDGADGATAL
jgi:hypothetical protein